MKQYLKSAATQATAILLAAGAAALFTFFQSLATQTGVCPLPAGSPEQAGALGALFKGAHSIFTMTHIKHFS